MPTRDKVTLSVAGKPVTAFSAVSVSMAVDQIADQFSLSVPFDLDAPLVRPRGFERVTIMVDGELLMTGKVDKLTPALTESGRIIQIEGRSLPGVLMDCSIDGALEYSGLALSTIARQICSPFGVSVRPDNDTNALELAVAEYGQTPAEFLNSLAAPRHILLNSSYSGQLVISWGKSLMERPVVADLTEGEAPVVSVSADYDNSKLHSIYKVGTQFADEIEIVGSASDPLVTSYRPKLVKVDDIDISPDVTARRARTEGLAAFYSVTVGLTGWRRPDGKRWAERQMVTLVAPSAFVNRRTRYLVAGCTPSLSDGERTTSLRLVPPEIYAGQMPKAEPWA
jgi:prophage tail gpP-like protein